MQTINFFETICGFETTQLEEFGIYDDPRNDEKSYLVFDVEETWTLSVLNKNKKSIQFYPIDGCVKILKENTNDKESTCDGMLLYDNQLILIELTEDYYKSVQDCIDQIKSTILLFIKLHPNLNLSKRFAVVSNLAKPNSTISFERCEEFREDTGFGLSIKTILKIK
jgi:hypothetical protein